MLKCITFVYWTMDCQHEMMTLTLSVHHAVVSPRNNCSMTQLLLVTVMKDGDHELQHQPTNLNT